jgi:hypothetical protein
MPVEEVIVPFADTKTQPATELRSTLLTTSIRSLRARSLFERYVANLPPERREEIVTSVAGVWLPLELGVAHYNACGALQLPLHEQQAIGKEVGDRVQGTFLGVTLRTVRGAGVTPWNGLSACGRLYERLFVGGAVQLVKLGPKEARLDFVNNALFGLPYFRFALHGVVATGAELFCAKAYVHDLPRYESPTSVSLRVSWA